MKHLWRDIFQDWEANSSNPKGRIVMLMFRIASHARSKPNWSRNPITLTYGAFYRVLVEWVLGIEIPWKLNVGRNFVFYHGVGIVINDAAQIGCNVTLRHNVTIGSKSNGGQCPTIGDDVQVGAGAILLGGIHIGHGATIAAGSVVVKDVESMQTVAGNPACVLPEKR